MVYEIATFPASEAFIADPLILKPALDLIVKHAGFLKGYHAIAEEDKKSAFLFLEWDTIESHKAVIAHPEYPEITAKLGVALSGKPELVHVDFNRDPASVFAAPITEIVFFDSKDAPREKIDAALDGFTSKLAKEAGTYGLTWGSVVEAPSTYYLLIGWESVQRHQEVMALDAFTEDRARMREAFGDYKVFHAKVQSGSAS